MSDVSPLGQKAIELARSGDLVGALEAAKEGISANPSDPGLRFFAGMLDRAPDDVVALAPALVDHRDVLRSDRRLTVHV